MAYREVRDVRTEGPVAEYGASAPRAVNEVRWGAVFSGSVVALGFMALFGSLWVAWGYGSHTGEFTANLRWWLAGTAICAMFVAGLVTGFVSGVRGFVAGLLNSLTTWGLITAVALFIAIGVAFGSVLNTSHVSTTSIASQVAGVEFWTTFGAIVVGLITCTIGGVLGGLIPRAVHYPPLVQPHRDVYPEDRYEAERTAAVGRRERL